jgi:hypothetical protein
VHCVYLAAVVVKYIFLLQFGVVCGLFFALGLSSD